MTAPLVCSWRQSIAERDPAEWAALAGTPGDFAMDTRFLATVEHAFRREARFWNVMLQTPDGTPAAAAFVSLYPIDAALFLQGRARRFVEQVRRLVPSFFKYRVLFCGCPVSTGASHVRLAPGADPLAVFRVLDAGLDRLARQRRARLIVFKEFDETEAPAADALTRLGYLRADSLPMNYLPPHFGSFDELCAAMRSRYRNNIRHSRKKFVRAGLRVEHVRDTAVVERLYTDEVHRLYLAVLERAEVKLERLPAEFFRGLARRFPGDAAFNFLFRDQRVVGFTSGLFHGGHYANLFCGVDYAVNDEADLYFNLMFHDADYALRAGAKSIHVGQTADDFKSRMGCFARPRCFYVRGRGNLLPRILRAAAPRLFPPVPLPPPRNLFSASVRDDVG
jgi:predicted N-acyltransferase